MRLYTIEYVLDVVKDHMRVKVIADNESEAIQLIKENTSFRVLDLQIVYVEDLGCGQILSEERLN